MKPPGHAMAPDLMVENVQAPSPAVFSGGASSNPRGPARRPAWQVRQAFQHPHYFKALEIAINDFCNLTCKLCSQGTPYQQVKRVIRLPELRRLSTFFRPYEFRTIKLSGGEPTIHPDFAEICQELHALFPAKRYVLATNGALLKKYLGALEMFTVVELSHYPGQNDAEYQELLGMRLPKNVFTMSKHDYAEMIDVFTPQNRGKVNVFEHCGSPRQIFKIVQNRIYPCCIVFGLSNLRKTVTAEEVGVPVDEHWREHLQQLDIERHCKTCWVNVTIPRSRQERWRRQGLEFLHKAKALTRDCLP